MILFVMAIFIVGFGLLLSLGKTRTEAALTSGAQTPLDQVAEGAFATVRGVLDADETLTAPLSQTPCVYWRLIFEGDPKYAANKRERADVELYRTFGLAGGLTVRTEEGSVLLDADHGTELHVEREHRASPSVLGGAAEEVWREHAPGLEDSVRLITEQRLEADQLVTVTGHLQQVNGRRVLAGPDLAISALTLEAQRARARGTRVLGILAVAGGLFLAFASWEEARNDWAQSGDSSDELPKYEEPGRLRLRQHDNR